MNMKEKLAQQLEELKIVRLQLEQINSSEITMDSIPNHVKILQHVARCIETVKKYLDGK